MQMPISTAAIYDELLKLHIDLSFEDVPTPSYLQEKILDCSEALHGAEKRIIEVTRELSSKERELKLEQVRLDIKRRGLLVNDAEIKKLPTGKEREAAADRLLEKEHDIVVALENDVLELQNLLSSIRLVHQNLRTTNSDIRVLMRIMEQQIFKLNIGTKEDKEMRHLMKSFEEVEKVEDELTPDDVESSSEVVQTETPDSRSEGASQTKTASAPDEAGSVTEDDLGSIASFLTEDSEENGGEKDRSEEPQEEAKKEQPAQSAVGEGGAKDKNSASSTTEAIGDDGGGLQVTNIDIDLGDLLEEPPKSSAIVPTVSKEKSSVKVAAPPAAPATKQEPPPKQAPPKKGPVSEMDIDDILDSLDG